MADGKRSGWFYLFVGCGVLALAVFVIGGAGVFMTIRWAKNFKQEIEDPEARAANAKELLGTSTLPEGYHPAMHLRLPFGVGRMVVLTDGDPGESAEPSIDGEHMFMYMEGPGWDRDWKAFAAGGDPPFEDLGDLNINLDAREWLGKGELAVGGMEVFYSASRGEVSGERFHSDDGVFTILLVRCPGGDKKSRTILWSGPPAAEGVDDPLLGTTGDPQRISTMMENFRLCG